MIHLLSLVCLEMKLNSEIAKEPLHELSWKTKLWPFPAFCH